MKGLVETIKEEQRLADEENSKLTMLEKYNNLCKQQEDYYKNYKPIFLVSIEGMKYLKEVEDNFNNRTK